MRNSVANSDNRHVGGILSDVDSQRSKIFSNKSQIGGGKDDSVEIEVISSSVARSPPGTNYD